MKRIQPQLEQLDRIQADILVLTETHESLAPASLAYCVTSDSAPDYHKPGESCVAIWSRWPLTKCMELENPALSVCADIDSPYGVLTVYGTILTWKDDRGPEKISGPWVEHEKAIVRQGGEWCELARRRDGVPLIVAGDFNQARDGVGRYKSPNGVRLLDEEMSRANLYCITEEDFGAVGKIHPDPQKGYYRHNIDHICITRGEFHVQQIGAWDHFTDILELSDHNGVYADLELR